jgi:hypothetical protein
MEDFDAFTRDLRSVADLRGCVIATRDGRVLGAYPNGSPDVEAAWRQIADIGACTSAIVQLEDETWFYLRRGSHAAFVVVHAAQDPGRVIACMGRLLVAMKTASAGEDVLVDVPEPPPGHVGPEGDELDEVDRVALVRELSRLQDNGATADG